MKLPEYVLLTSTQSAVTHYMVDSFSEDGKGVLWLIGGSDIPNVDNRIAPVNDNVLVQRMTGGHDLASHLGKVSVETEVNIAIFCSNMEHCLSDPLTDPQIVIKHVREALRDGMQFCRWACNRAKYGKSLRNVVLVIGDCDCCVCSIVNSSTRMLLRSSAQELAENQVAMNGVKVQSEILAGREFVWGATTSDQIVEIIKFLSSSQSKYVSGNIISVPFEGPV